MKKSIISIVLGFITLLTLVGCESDKVEKIDIVSFQEIGGRPGANQMLLTLEVNIPNSATQAEVDSAKQVYLSEWQQSHPEYIVSKGGYQSGYWHRETYDVRHFSHYLKSVK